MTADSFDDRDLTVMMQGPLPSIVDLQTTVSKMRTLFPRAQFILSTQRANLEQARRFDVFDRIVPAFDPGALPSVKFDGEPHNVNRQIATSAAGLAAVTTEYALKMRADAYVESRAMLDFWRAWAGARRGDHGVGAGRLLVSSLYTLNPRYDECLPYHVSDWIQFGLTSDVRRLWTCPPYGLTDATYYERIGYRPGSLPRECEFRARFATEQWLALHYLFPNSDFPIRFHNDCSEAIARSFEDALVDNFIVVHPRDIGLKVPKHERIYQSRYANLRNYSYEDWKRLVAGRCRETRTLVGYTKWPRTEFQKSLYMIIRRKRRARTRAPVSVSADQSKLVV